MLPTRNCPSRKRGTILRNLAPRTSKRFRSNHPFPVSTSSTCDASMSGRIVIQGIGGIGGVVAGALIDAGMRPVLVTNNADITNAIRGNGLSVKLPDRSFTVQADVHTTLAETQGP